MAWFSGVPREEIEWYPTIDEDRCVGCGMCLNCGKRVYEWRDGKAWVKNPYACVVGCNTCANLCLGDTITFPDIEELRDFYREHRIWLKVREELVREGKIPADDWTCP